MPSHLSIPPVSVGSSLLTPGSSLTLVNGENNGGNFSFSELEGRDPAEQVRRSQNNVIYSTITNFISYLNLARDPQ